MKAILFTRGWPFFYGLRMPITLNRLLTNDKSANDAFPAGFAPAPWKSLNAAD